MPYFFRTNYSLQALSLCRFPPGAWTCVGDHLFLIWYSHRFPSINKTNIHGSLLSLFFSLKDTVFLFHSLGKIFKCIWKIFQKMLQIVALWATIQIMSYHWQDINPEMYKISVFFLLTQQFFYITTLNVLESLLPKLWLIFCCHQKKIQKICYFWCFNVYDSGNKHDN